jgi:hypothetical protein
MKIEISEHCFGPDVKINGESLNEHEYDKRDEQEISKLKGILLNQLYLSIDKISMSDWKMIAEIVTTIGNFEYDDSNSHESLCDQCSNYNTFHTYNKIKND